MTRSWLAPGLVALTCAISLPQVAWAAALAGARGPSSGDSLSVAGAFLPHVPSPLSLEDALRFAREHNPELRIARAALDVARAESTFARVRPFNPVVEFRQSRGGQSLGSGTDGAFEIGLDQEVELGGKRSGRQAVASARVRTATLEYAATLQAIESEVRASFQRTLFLRDRLDLLTQLTELDRRVSLSTQARVRDGSVTPLTGRLTDLDLLRIDAQRRRSRSDYRQAHAALGLVLGRSLPDSIRLEGTITVDSLAVPEDSVVATALRSRRQGEVLQRRIQERRAEHRLAVLEARPNLTVGVGLASDKLSLSGADFRGDPAVVRGISGATDTDRLWTARVSVPLPFWQRNQVARARAASEIVRSQSEYDSYAVRTELEVRAAARGFEDAAELYAIYLERSTRVRQDLVLVLEAYADGRISLDSYLAQKGRLVDTLISQLEAGDAYWETRSALESAVGLALGHLNRGGER